MSRELIAEVNLETVVIAETAIIGVALANPERIPDAGELEGAAFRDLRYRRAWDELRRRYDAGEEIDPLIVSDALGPPFSGDPTILSSTLTAAAVPMEHAAAIVREAYATRQVLAAIEAVALAHKRDDARGTELVSYALEKLSGIRVDRKDTARSIGDVLRARFADLAALAEAKARGDEALTGIATGVRDLDTLLGGLQLGRITVIAARPGMGKSALARQIADHCSSRGLGVHDFVLEDHWTAKADRVLSAATGMSAQDIRRLNIRRGDIANLRDAAKLYSSRDNWLIDDRSSLLAEEIARSVRRHRPRINTRLVIVDYVQLLQRRPGEGAREMIERSMKALLALARGDDLSVVVLSQLNRKCEMRDDKRPQLSDLKESGALEEEAKTVLFLYREHQYDKNADPTELEIIIEKNNDGETGPVRAKWHGPTMTISTWPKEETPPPPPPYWGEDYA
jgi:replicative DNA helicase